MMGEVAYVSEKMLSHKLHQPCLTTARMRSKLTVSLNIDYNVEYYDFIFLIEYTAQQMLAYSSRRSTNRKGLQLHSVLRDFKKFEQEKHILQNRINIMHNNQIKNEQIAKNIEHRVDLLKQAHARRKTDQTLLQKQINQEKQRQRDRKRLTARKVKEEQKKVEQTRKILSHSRLTYANRTRSQSRMNRERLQLNKRVTIMENRNRKESIHNSIELGKSKVQKYKTNKLINLKSETTSQVLQQIKLNQSAEMQLALLQKLEKQMVLKFSQSLTSLRKSRSGLTKIATLRA